MRILVVTTALATITLTACGNRSGNEALSEGEIATDTAETAKLVAAGFHRPDPERIPSQLATNPGEPWGDFVGGNACADCHSKAYAEWRNSFHSRTLYDIAPETVMGRFDGEPIIGGKDGQRFFEITPFVETDDSTGRTRFFMRLRWLTPEEGGVRHRSQADTYEVGELPDIDDTTVEVVYAFGNRRHQPYIARWPDANGEPGRHWVLPIFWNDVEETWKWLGFRIYVRHCAQCHVTGIESDEIPHEIGQPTLTMTSPPRYNLPPERERWADGAVSCEACHGPGRTHVEAVEALGADRYRELRANNQKPPTIWDGVAGEPEHQADMCGSCHNFYTESFVTWQPGPTGFTRDARRRPLEPSPRSIGWQFYADGSHMSPCTVVEVFRKSRHSGEEDIGCGNCHDAHGTDNWADLTNSHVDNALCIDCHAEFETPDAQSAHSRHEAGGAGNICAECHMPRHMAFSNGVHVMSERIYSHEFSIPTGVRKPGGPPPACNVCHTDRDDAWTRQEIERLWGGGGSGTVALTGAGAAPE